MKGVGLEGTQKVPWCISAHRDEIVFVSQRGKGKKEKAETLGSLLIC